MNTINFSVGMLPIELRNAAGVLEGIAKVVETNQANGIVATVSNDDECISVIMLDDGGRLDVYPDTPLTSQQAMMLTTEELARHTGRILTGSETGNEKTAAAAFGDDDVAEKVDLDEDGLPHDARIHAPSKLKLKREGTWKLKKGIDKELVATVKAELTAAMSAPTVTTATVTDISTASKPAAPGPAGPASPAAPEAPEAPAAKVKYVTDDGEWTRAQLLASLYTDEQIDALPIAGQTVAVEDVTFPELMQLITPALAANTITDEQVTAACVKHGVASIALISARPDLIPSVKVELFG